MGRAYRCKNGRTSFEKIQKTQKLSRKDALKIRACWEELPHMENFYQTLAEMYGVTPNTVRRIVNNELHCD